MVILRFPTIEIRRQALGYLLGRFSGKSWATGEVMVPEVALPHLAAEGINFSVEGQATYDRILHLNQQVEKRARAEEPLTPA
jgi:hypothetical protein